MTRAERIEKYLTGVNHATHATPELITLMTSTVLAIADDRRYLMLGDIAAAMGRPRSTVLSWIERGTYSFPQPVGRTSGGMIWDAEEIDIWTLSNPGLCRPVIP